jgi:uncharacterized protein (TIGR04255 family)
MSFRPANDHHAIQLAGIAIGLDKPMRWQSLDAVIKTPMDWRSQVPAIDVAQVLDVQINPQTGGPAGRAIRGVEFSHKRPDGSAEWQLTAMGTEIKVETTEYTRWNEVWAKAGDMLINAAEQIIVHEREQNISVTNVALVLVDAFFSPEMDPDYGQLFLRNTDLLPSAVFLRGPVWHAYSGWFEERPEGNVLNQLNIDVRKGGIEQNRGARPDDQIFVSVQHNQFYRPQEPPLFTTDASIARLILEEIPLMHTANKNLVSRLLTEEMQRLINLNAADT